MSFTVASAALSKQAAAYVVKNPNETTNAFTVKSTSEASDILKVSTTKAITELKDALKGYDLTSITTRELQTIGSKLYENGLIDSSVAGQFIGGSLAFDVNGEQTDKDTKFNAIAMFNEMLADTRSVGSKSPQVQGQQDYQRVVATLVSTNQVVNALSYFVNSAQNDLSVNEQA